jgi:ketosteroid isomerase-like protein
MKSVQFIEEWARAVNSGNRAAILANHSADLVMFDFPDEVRGLDEYAGDCDRGIR